MRLTASLSSKISKRNTKKAQIPLMPSDMAFLHEVEQNRSIRKARSDLSQDQLQNQGPSPLEWRLSVDEVSTILEAITIVLDRRWPPIPDKGLGREGRGKVHALRTKDIPRTVLTTHLYGVFPDRATFVDREVRAMCEAGKLRRLVVNQVNSSDILMFAEDFYQMLYESTLRATESGNDEMANCLRKLETILRAKPSAISLTADDIKASGETIDKSLILACGFLTLNPGTLDVFNISLPNIGSFLKLTNNGRAWVLKTLEKQAWKESLESQLATKWESNKQYWHQFAGLKLEWVLYDCVGGGWIEPFKTPVGRGWKLTGKK